MKYAILLLNAVGVLILGTALSLLLRPMSHARIPPLGEASSSSQAADQKALEETRQTLFTLEQLKLGMGHPLAAEATTATLIAQPAPGNSALDGRARASGTAAAQPEAPPLRRLTLLLETQEGRSAIIDGQLVRRGDHLPGDERVLELAADHAVISDKQGRKTLTLPLDQMRVGKVSSNPLAGIKGSNAAAMNAMNTLTLVPPLKPAGSPP